MEDRERAVVLCHACAIPYRTDTLSIVSSGLMAMRRFFQGVRDGGDRVLDVSAATSVSAETMLSRRDATAIPDDQAFSWERRFFRIVGHDDPEATLTETDLPLEMNEGDEIDEGEYTNIGEGEESRTFSFPRDEEEKKLTALFQLPMNLKYTPAPCPICDMELLGANAGRRPSEIELDGLEDRGNYEGGDILRKIECGCCFHVACIEDYIASDAPEANQCPACDTVMSQPALVWIRAARLRRLSEEGPPGEED